MRIPFYFPRLTFLTILGSELILVHGEIASSNGWMHGNDRPQIWQRHTSSGNALEIQHPRLTVKNFGPSRLCHSPVRMPSLLHFAPLSFFFYMQILQLANLVTLPKLYTRMRPFFNTASLVQRRRNPRLRSPWSFLRFIGSYGGFVHDSVSMPSQKHYAISIMYVLFLLL